MVPEGEKEAVFNALLAHLDSIGNHFDTGIMATPLLLKALSDNGRADIAFRLMNQREIPGFGLGFTGHLPESVMMKRSRV